MGGIECAWVSLSISAPLLMRALTNRIFPSTAAYCMGANPWLSLKFGFAPNLNKNNALSVSFSRAALVTIGARPYFSTSSKNTALNNTATAMRVLLNAFLWPFAAFIWTCMPRCSPLSDQWKWFLASCFDCFFLVPFEPKKDAVTVAQTVLFAARFLDSLCYLQGDSVIKPLMGEPVVQNEIIMQLPSRHRPAWLGPPDGCSRI